MITVLAIYIIIFTLLYLVSYRRYSEIIGKLEKKEFPMKGLLPVGLYILDTFKYSYNTSYDRKLLMAEAELYGHKKALDMLRIHWGSKISLMILSVVFLLFVGTMTKPDAGYAVFCLLLQAGIVVFSDRDLMEKVKKRRQSIQLDFPDFVNKLTLLVNAGMTISRAWEKAVSDTCKQTPLYIELGAAILDIKSGVPEYKAFEEFAQRCHVPVITRFVSVALQNIRKGNDELVPVFRLFASECWEMRKSTARKFGEEASTKLLFPMMLMLTAILLIVGMPAVLALRNI
jgi:tight adherence protein C